MLANVIAVFVVDQVCIYPLPEVVAIAKSNHRSVTLNARRCLEEPTAGRGRVTLQNFLVPKTRTRTLQNFLVPKTRTRSFAELPRTQTSLSLLTRVSRTMLAQNGSEGLGLTRRLAIG